jgi:hypothetical protein
VVFFLLFCIDFFKRRISRISFTYITTCLICYTSY